jgi:hypothetical protein
MGSMPYQQLAPWHPDPNDSLFDLQATFIAENYDLPQVIQEHLESSREALRICEEDGDEYGILNIYQADVDFLESIAGQTLPEAPQDRISVLRKICKSGGQGIGNILDITSVTDKGGIHVTRRLSDKDVEQLLGTAHPSITDAGKLIGIIADQLGRGESVCCPVYDGDKPRGWWFIGYTID